MGHEGKCRHLHGHNYEVFLTAVQKSNDVEELDTLGRIIDFSILKHKVGNWVEQNWDHGMILFSEDGDAIKVMASLPEQKFFLLPYNPTAENLAKYLIKEICPSLLRDTNVDICKVVVNETENCSAEVEN